MNPLDSIIQFISGGIEGLLNIVPTIFIIAVFSGYLIGYVFIIYHLLRFGIGIVPKLLAGAFTIISAILLTLLLRQYMLINFIELFHQIAVALNFNL